MLTVNSTSNAAAALIPFGTDITVTAYLYNPLHAFNDVSATPAENDALGDCGADLFTSIEVYSGFFTAANVSNGTPLQLFKPDESLLCVPMQLVSFVHMANNFTIFPESRIAVLNGNQVVILNETSVISGYWTGSGENYIYQSFPVGKYTALISDQWGQMVFFHFTIFQPSP
jgi:hypothetical protein